MHCRKLAHKGQLDSSLTSLRRSARLLYMDQPDLVSTSEAKDIIGCSIATVNRHAAAGRLPIAKQIDGIRGARLYHRADVEALRDEMAAAS